MDQLIGQLLDKGITTTIAVVFLYFCWHVITRTLPEQRTGFLSSLREQRTEFLSSLREQTEQCSIERKEAAERHERINDRMSIAVEGLSAEIRALRAERQDR